MSEDRPIRISNVKLYPVPKDSQRLMPTRDIPCMECGISLLKRGSIYKLNYLLNALSNLAIEVGPDEYHGYCHDCMEILKVCPKIDQ